MKIKIYLFRLVVAFTAFIFGISFFSVGQYLKSVFQTKKQETVAIQPVIKQEILSAPPVVQPTVTTADSRENTVSEFDGTGDYYIIGDLPKGFEDFEDLNITTRDYENASEENDYQGTIIPPEGFILTKKEYKFTRINIADKQLAFETETKKGISYKFVGKFTDEANYEEDEEYVVLEGRLIKMRDGKKIAESKIRFGIMDGC
ncbi:MAG: hypothetical protein ACR2MG_11935 [Pyrinomonadaceae bacterium]